MILCRRLMRVYDVDLAGAGAMLAIGLAGYFAVVRPAGAGADERRQLEREAAVAARETESASARLKSCEQDARSLREGIARVAARVPRVRERAETFNALGDLAQRCGLVIEQLAPQAPQRVAGRTAADGRFAGHGTLGALLAFLQALDRERPHYSVEDLVLHAPELTDAPRCALSFTLRLYLLEDELLEAGEAPTP
ncbi:MAG: hypothetical protein HRF50_12175 [Phycisphaerae bacterium]|jgi:hypothetical protein